MEVQTTFKQRLLAVFDYDGIPQNKRAAHVASACGCSLTTARRLLTEAKNAARMNSRWLFDLADGLNVNWLWLYEGNFERFDPRTARIQLSEIERKSQAEVDSYIAPLLSGVDGEPDYLPLGYDHTLRFVMAIELYRRMTEWEGNKFLRLALRLLNNDAKVLRLSEMCKQGQITRTQLFGMM
ncbi:MAG: hypothetical protein COZ77_07185 [Gallionellales bacterium CG_4_8_14_3_um_filter_54_18]|nr:MAG: hypothetical protein COZ77_07185 [Gallionellales bacterium CG_4_8_14_3_um_filter_54_18]PIY01079.1 MAG: hypothetical protein COZ23_05025 [Hydrogenophilales bacterium CG_4_10_14_3_um_filter_58_23]PJB06340.1 MAG: hypothetical protein CO125_07260 [Hydrogenophilales bacterium CG_4_9_14_3_um_filter_59_35]